MAGHSVIGQEVQLARANDIKGLFTNYKPGFSRSPHVGIDKLFGAENSEITEIHPVSPVYYSCRNQAI